MKILMVTPGRLPVPAVGGWSSGNFDGIAFKI